MHLYVHIKISNVLIKSCVYLWNFCNFNDYILSLEFCLAIVTVVIFRQVKTKILTQASKMKVSNELIAAIKNRKKLQINAN